MGAHAARLWRAPIFPMLLLALSLVLSSCSRIAHGATTADALLKFKASLQHADALKNWDPVTTPCAGDKGNWVGVLCLKGKVWGLQLEHMNLDGKIDVDALAQIPSLRTLSFMNNKFTGPLPDLRKLGALRSLYLSNNQFSGDVPSDAFQTMASLRRVFLANNEFTGAIPGSLAALPRLLEVRLEGNQFVGQIPTFAGNVKMVNVADNALEGPIPLTLTKMNPAFFAGNKDLCGPPLQQCGTPPAPEPPFPDLPPSQEPSPSPPPATASTKKMSGLLIAGIVIAILALLLAICAIIIAVCKRRQKSQVIPAAAPPMTSTNHAVMASVPRNRSQHSQVHGMPEKIRSTKKTDKLIFLEDERERFDLHDLLRASAEVLGSGAFGSSYKAVLSSTNALVVKRYKQMSNVGREDFHEHMRRLGRLSHPHLLPLVAYYYRREEKLLVTDFVSNGSLASQLHGNHTVDQPGLDWPTRLRIVKGITRALAYLYHELPSVAIPHGHLKSSNVLLDQNYEPVLSDYGLLPVINPEQAQTLLVAFKSPEFSQQGQVTRKTDIWCLGILILEILTGKFPENYLVPVYDSQADLASWVNSTVKEKRTGDVFDSEMGRTKYSKSEMLKLMKIGLTCCEVEVDRRPEIEELVVQIEELKEGDGDVDHHTFTTYLDTPEDVGFPSP